MAGPGRRAVLGVLGDEVGKIPIDPDSLARKRKMSMYFAHWCMKLWGSKNLIFFVWHVEQIFTLQLYLMLVYVLFLPRKLYF